MVSKDCPSSREIQVVPTSYYMANKLSSQLRTSEMMREWGIPVGLPRILDLLIYS